MMVHNLMRPASGPGAAASQTAGRCFLTLNTPVDAAALAV